MIADQQTIDCIDRVCVGLAYLTIESRDEERWYNASTHRPPDKFAPYVLLLDLIGCDLYKVHIPEWAKRALADHQGRPEELVQALRELAAKNSTKEPEPFPY